MRHLKVMLVALMVAMGTSLYANPVSSSFEESKKSSVSYEIEKLLRNSQLVIEEDFTVTVIFEVTGDRTIDIRLIRSSNEEVNAFLQKRLQDHKLKGKGWFTEKIYELPIKVKSGKK